MLRDDIFADAFPIFLNGKMYKLDWLKKPRLQSSIPVDIGMDQSSTSSGITVQSKDLLFIAELPRGYMTVSEYKQALRRELDFILDGIDIRHFIFEKHGRHITPLHSVINEITDVLKGYTKPMLYDDVYVKGILPPVWRSGFLPKAEYAGRFRRDEVKWACVEEAVKRRPELECYIKYANKKDGVPDYDGFESFGIINGFLDLNYTESGQRIINTSMEFRNGRKFNYVIEKCTIFDVEEKIKYMRSTYGYKDCPVLLGNNSILIDQSMNRLLDDYREAIIVLPKDNPEIPRLIVELGQEHLPEDAYLIYVRGL